MTPDRGPAPWRIQTLTLLVAVLVAMTGLVTTAQPADAAPNEGHPNLVVRAASKIGQGWGSLHTTFAGDINADGWHDILAVTPDRRLLLYRGASSTGYRAPVQVGTGWGAPLLDYASVDFTGDGLADILTTHSNGSLLLYVNNAKGGFKAGVKIGQGWGAVRTWTAVQDGPNGHPAIYAVHTSGYLYRYDTNGRGTFTKTYKVGPGWASVAHIHNGGDLVRNGVSDLLAVDNAGVLRVYTARPNTTSMTAYRLGHGFRAYEHLGIVTEPGTATHLRGVHPDGRLINWVISWTGSPPPAPKPPEVNAVFVYGTLMTGQPNHSRLAGDYSSKQRTGMSGLALYRMSGYSWPWAVVRSGFTTQGEVYWLKPGRWQAAIADLDRLEGYNPSKPATNQSYVRVKRTMTNGFQAWVYVAGPRTAQWMQSSGSVIPSGDWLRR